MSETRDKVAGIFAAELRMDAAAFADDTTFADVSADGLDMIEIVMALEEAFAIEITDDEWTAIHTFGEAVHLVQQKLGENA